MERQRHTKRDGDRRTKGMNTDVDVDAEEDADEDSHRCTYTH